MKKFFILFLIILHKLIICQEKIITDSTLFSNAKIDSTINDDTIRTHYTDCVLKSKAYYKKKKYYETTFYHNGSIKIQMIRKRDRDSTIVYFKTYDEEGNLIFDQQNKKKCIAYDRAEGMVIYVNMKKNEPHGKGKKYKDGKLYETMNYKNGYLSGKSTVYDTETNEIIMVENYLNGKLNGESLYYNKGKVLSRRIFYKDDCPFKVQSYNSVGALIHETTDLREINWRYRSTEYCNQ